MLIPGAVQEDPADLAAVAQVNASSFHTGGAGPFAGTLALNREAFAVFPALPGQEIRFFVESSGAAVLTAGVYSAMLPNRLQPGQERSRCTWEVEAGCQALTWTVPADFPAAFCMLVWPPQPAVRLYLSRPLRTGFLCGWTDSPRFGEPALCYTRLQPGLYTPDHVREGPNRPWGGINQWRTAPEDKTPWLELRWPKPVRPRELRLYLDPELSMELPSSRGSHWQESHKFAPRTAMPEQLLRDFEILLQREDGGWVRARSLATSGYVSLVVCNSCTKPLRMRNGRYLSSKGNSRVGVGLSTVQEIARRYGGRAEFSADGVQFRAAVFLPCNRAAPPAGTPTAHTAQDTAMQTTRLDPT